MQKNKKKEIFSQPPQKNLKTTAHHGLINLTCFKISNFKAEQSLYLKLVYLTK